jgi:hypothetical protein
MRPIGAVVSVYAVLGLTACADLKAPTAPVIVPSAPLIMEEEDCDPDEMLRADGLTAENRLPASTVMNECEDPDPGPGSPAGTYWPFFGPPGDPSYQAPNDPYPNAPGIWLGANVTPAYCFNDLNTSIIDSDKDWLADHCELELARAFAPRWGQSVSDGCPGGEPLWAAKYFNATKDVRLGYLPAYYNDCGGGSIGDHRGDSEFVMVQVHFNSTTQHWEFQQMWLSAHYGTTFDTDRSRWVDDSETRFSRRPLGHPWISVAKRKHANYRNDSVCGDGTFVTDDCVTTEINAIFRFPIDPARNIGSRHVPMGCIPMKTGSTRTECFLSESRSFCGWHITSTKCGSPYHGLLMGDHFEKQVQDMGPGPAPYTAPQTPPPPVSNPYISGPGQLQGDEWGTWTIVWSGHTLSSCTWYRDESLVQEGSCTYSTSFYDWPSSHWFRVEVWDDAGVMRQTPYPDFTVYVNSPGGGDATLRAPATPNQKGRARPAPISTPIRVTTTKTTPTKKH